MHVISSYHALSDTLTAAWGNINALGNALCLIDVFTSENMAMPYKFLHGDFAMKWFLKFYGYTSPPSTDLGGFWLLAQICAPGIGNGLVA